MTVKLPKWARALIYVLNVLGTPVVVYLRAKDIIGDLELALWGAEVAAGFTVAGLNLPASPPAEPIIEIQRGRGVV